MSEVRDTGSLQPASNGVVGLLTRHRQVTAYGLFTVAVALAGLAVWLFYLAGDVSRQEVCTATGIWLTLLAIATVGAGFFQFLHAQDTEQDGWTTRVMVLTVGGLVGLLTVCLAGFLVDTWWPALSGGLKTWRQDWWQLGLCGVTGLGGLAVMFASLQLARAGERSAPWMRRLLYGYNTVLTGLLLLAILGVANVLTYVPLKPFKAFNTITDWTAANLYGLSDASKNILARLDKPVKIYAIVVDKDDVGMSAIKPLLANCQAASSDVQVEYISPDLDDTRLSELAKKYSIRPDAGLLIVYGTPPKEDHEFIKLNDMFTHTGQKVGFSGESMLMNKLSVLSQHHARAVIYITQGNGEPDLNNTDERARDEGLGILKTRLEHRNYDVRPLHLDALTKVPDDAAVVVVACPTNPALSVQALDEYMNPRDKNKKPGKLIVMEDVRLGTDGKMVHTPLDTFVARYGVEARDDRLLSLVSSFAVSPAVQVVVNPELRGSNAIARAFQNMNSRWANVRTLSKQSPPPGANSPYDVSPLLEAMPPTLSQTNFREDARTFVANLFEHREELIRQAHQAPVPVAMAVTSPRDMSGNPHARLGPQQPRMLVFGDVTWITNPNMSERSREPSYDLFTSSLAWLQERPDVGASSESKERNIYAPQMSPATQSYLKWLPLTLMLVGFVGLGGGIWAVRRR